MLLRRLGLAVATALLASSFLLAFSGCAGKTPAPVSVAISDVVDCAKGAAHETSLHILDDAATALATKDWEGSLMDLVTRFGGDAVSCVLAKIADDSAKMLATNGDAIEGTKATRARHWLEEHKVVFASTADGGAQ